MLSGMCDRLCVARSAMYGLALRSKLIHEGVRGIGEFGCLYGLCGWLVFVITATVSSIS